MTWNVPQGRLALLMVFLAGSLCGLTLAALPGRGLDAPVAAQDQKAPAGPRYAVVHSEGTNLIVTDHKTNTLYFYATELGAEPGSDLELRGSLDLNRVGEAVLKPKLLRKSKPQN